MLQDGLQLVAVMLSTSAKLAPGNPTQCRTTELYLVRKICDRLPDTKGVHTRILPLQLYCMLVSTQSLVRPACLCCAVLQRGMTTKSMGYLTLSRTPPNKVEEVCAQLTAMQNTTQLPPQENGQPAPIKWFFHLFNLRFVLQNSVQAQASVAAPAANGTADAAAGTAANSAAAGSTTSVAVAAGEETSSIAPPAGMPADVPMQTCIEPAQYQHFMPTAKMLELERQLRAAARAAGGATVATHGQPDLHLPACAATAAVSGMRVSRNSSSSSSSSSVTTREELWRQLQRQHQWPDGQLVFESMYRPCVSDEANLMCMEDCGLM
jgi:hypothetical protein